MVENHNSINQGRCQHQPRTSTKIADGKVSILFKFNAIADNVNTEMWSSGIGVGEAWDASCPCPLLLKNVQTPGMIPPGRALVPGCGRGYDLVALASEDRFVVGLELSNTAVEEARQYIANLSDSTFEFKHQTSVECRSFFDLRPTEFEGDRFQFVYDYTFLCALDPSVRGDWADKMASIIVPGGLLLTLIFPIWPTAELEEEKKLVNFPPYPLSLSLLKELLIPRGFECLELRYLNADEAHPGRAGDKNVSIPRLTGAISGVGRWRRL